MDKGQRKSFFELISVVQVSILCSSQVDDNLDFVQFIILVVQFSSQKTLMVSLCLMKAPWRGSEKYPLFNKQSPNSFNSLDYMYFPLDFLLSWQKYNFNCEDVFLKRYLVSFLQRCSVPPRAVRALDLQFGGGPSSSPALTACWIWSRYSPEFKSSTALINIANWFAPGQLRFLTRLCLIIYLFQEFPRPH